MSHTAIVRMQARMHCALCHIAALSGADEMPAASCTPHLAPLASHSLPRLETLLQKHPPRHHALQRRVVASHLFALSAAHTSGKGLNDCERCCAPDSCSCSNAARDGRVSRTFNSRH